MGVRDGKERSIGELQKRAENYFKKRWPKKREFAEDFGSYCAVKWLEKKSTETNLYRLGIDFLRTFTGGAGPYGSRDVLSQSGNISFETFNTDPNDLRRNLGGLGSFEQASVLSDSRLSERERIILILYFEWGFTKKEISHVFGVAESRINKIFNEILADQKKRILSDETLIKVKRSLRAR